jgi:hypothetical protein
MQEEIVLDSLEYIRLWEVLKIVKKEYKSIYKEFGLDSEIADIYYDCLELALNNHDWLEVIDWASTLAQNTRFDLLENGIDIEVMHSLMSNLLEMINIATKKQERLI